MFWGSMLFLFMRLSLKKSLFLTWMSDILTQMQTSFSGIQFYIQCSDNKLNTPSLHHFPIQGCQKFKINLKKSTNSTKTYKNLFLFRKIQKIERKECFSPDFFSFNAFSSIKLRNFIFFFRKLCSTTLLLIYWQKILSKVHPISIKSTILC